MLLSAQSCSLFLILKLYLTTSAKVPGATPGHIEFIFPFLSLPIGSHYQCQTTNDARENGLAKAQVQQNLFSFKESCFDIIKGFIKHDCSNQKHSYTICVFYLSDDYTLSNNGNCISASALIEVKFINAQVYIHSHSVK